MNDSLNRYHLVHPIHNLRPHCPQVFTVQHHTPAIINQRKPKKSQPTIRETLGKSNRQQQLVLIILVTIAGYRPNRSYICTVVSSARSQSPYSSKDCVDFSKTYRRLIDQQMAYLHMINTKQQRSSLFIILKHKPSLSPIHRQLL